MRNRPAICVSMLLAVFGAGGCFAREHGHHEEEQGNHKEGHAHDEHAGGPAMTMTKTVNGYRYTLKIKPDHPVANREIELEADILEAGSGDAILGGFPVQGATVYFRYFVPMMKTHGDDNRHEAHAEGSSGVYGDHHTFPHGGRWMIEITGHTQDRKKRLPKVVFEADIASEDGRHHEEKQDHGRREEQHGHTGGGHH